MDAEIGYVKALYEYQIATARLSYQIGQPPQAQADLARGGGA
jgi:hypothetical protein